MRRLLVLVVVAGCDSTPAAPCDGCVLVEGLPEFSVIESLATDRDDRLVAGVVAVNRKMVARMSPSGGLDPTFGANGTARLDSLLSARSVVVMADGSIRIGGDRNGDTDPVVAGVTADGLDDGLRLIARDEAKDQSAIDLMEQDGALLVAYAEGRGFEGHLVRYTATGVRDPSFPPTPTERAIAIAPGGGFVMAGGYQDGDTRFLARRVTRDGAPDPSFAGGAPVIIPDVDRTSGFVSVAPSAAGGLILAGVANPTHPELFVARFDATGQLDGRFGGGHGYASHDIAGIEGVVGVIEAADGTIVVALSIVVDNVHHAAATRLAPDGSLDLAFGDGGQLVVDDDDSLLTSVVTMSSGDVVMGGRAQSRALLVRIPARAR
jgi:uncharacterized delta-60 repeat protein